jgi:hypothetical protein
MAADSVFCPVAVLTSPLHSLTFEGGVERLLAPTIPLRLNPHFLLEVDVDPRKSMDEQKVRE